MGGRAEFQPPLRGTVLFTGGAAEGVGAAGGQLHRAFAERHRILDGDDLEARDGGKARLDMLACGGGLEVEQTREIETTQSSFQFCTTCTHEYGG